MRIPATATQSQLVVHVRLTPKSCSARIAGVDDHGGMAVLKAYVTAPPEDGKANAALEALIAAWMGVPKSAATVIAGHKSRIKSVAITGGGEELLKKLCILLGASSDIPEKKRKGDGNG